MKRLVPCVLLFILSQWVSAQSTDQTELALKVVKTLSAAEMEGRETGTKGNTKARKYIIDQFSSLGYIVANDTFQFKKADKTIEGINISAEIKGTVTPDKYLIVTAHYDHIGINNGDIYYGADDNASGVGALIALAAFLKKNPTENSVLLVAFDAEEKGLKGAFHFMKNPSVAIKNILLNVNMDMLSQSKSHELYACGTYFYPWLKDIADSTADTFTNLTLKFGHDLPGSGNQNWTSQSDHFPFHEKGVPFIYFGVEDHPYYHKPEDTFDKIPQDFYFEVVNFIAAFVFDIDKQIDNH